MIEHIVNQAGVSQSFIVKPNCAMSWKGLVVCYAGMSCFSLGIAIGFYKFGLPLVLPFSGAEILLLGYAFYVTAWRGSWKEVVVITEDSVMIEKGHKKPEVQYEFQRPWANVVLEKSWNSWYPGRLLIRSKGRQLEIGAFLNEQERQGLAELLHKSLCPAYGLESGRKELLIN